MSPTQRTLALLRAQGWRPEVVEKWNPYARIRQDLFGCLDILALGDGVVLGVQACSGTDTAKRVAKLRAAAALPDLQRAGIRVEVWGWRKLKREGWQPHVVVIAPQTNPCLVERLALELL